MKFHENPSSGSQVVTNDIRVVLIWTRKNYENKITCLGVLLKGGYIRSKCLAG